MESKILNNSTRLLKKKKKKKIQLIINNGVVTVDKNINILPINTERRRIGDK